MFSNWKLKAAGALAAALATSGCADDRAAGLGDGATVTGLAREAVVVGEQLVLYATGLAPSNADVTALPSDVELVFEGTYLTDDGERTPVSVQARALVDGRMPDGREVREFPRLRHGGAHLKDPVADRLGDITLRGFRGLAVALLLWFTAAIVLSAAVAQRAGMGIEAAWGDVWRGRTATPWRAVLCALAVLAVFAGPVVALAPHYHVFGTDKVGQDVLYQALKSIRTGMVIGTLATLVMLPFALVLGVMAGYLKGRVDDMIQYLYTTLSSIPGVLLIAAAVLMMQVYIENHAALFPTTEIRADVRLIALCVILGVTSWTGLCRLLRGEALKLRELEYIQAAHAFGVSHWRIMTRHLMPNVMHIVMIALVMDFSGLVLAEAVLSYVGVGVDPSMISFGTMINSARLEMAREPMVWWSLAAAFVFMLALVLAANIFADAVRDAFDPRLVRAGAAA